MKRVLVVDDEENIRVVLRALLRKNGYEVEVADSGESALVLVDTFGPDVILTDVRMPKWAAWICSPRCARNKTWRP